MIKRADNLSRQRNTINSTLFFGNDVEHIIVTLLTQHGNQHSHVMEQQEILTWTWRRQTVLTPDTLISVCGKHHCWIRPRRRRHGLQRSCWAGHAHNNTPRSPVHTKEQFPCLVTSWCSLGRSGAYSCSPGTLPVPIRIWPPCTPIGARSPSLPPAYSTNVDL